VPTWLILKFSAFGAFPFDIVVVINLLYSLAALRFLLGLLLITIWCVKFSHIMFVSTEASRLCKPTVLKLLAPTIFDLKW